MIKAKVNGRQVSIETSWEELTFGKYLKFVNAKNDYNAFIGILLDLDPETVAKAKWEGLDGVLQSIQFLNTQKVEIDPVPTKVGDIKLPKDIAFETTEQFETLRQQVLKVNGEDSDLVAKTKALAMYCAIYCQPIKDNAPFDYEKAQWLAEEMMNYPCLEVMSAGNFFMAKCLSLTSGLPMSYLRKNTPLKRKRLDFAGLARRSGFTRLWTISRGIWASLTKKF